MTRKYTFDYRYFENIDNEAKAYWLGFIYADGCLCKNGRSIGLKISLSIKDKQILNDFKKELNFTGPVRVFKQKKQSKKVLEYCEVALNSFDMANDLQNIGVHFNKTKTITYPNLPKELNRHFVRGFWDGDGTVSMDRTYVRSALVSGSEVFVHQIADVIIQAINIKTRVYKDCRREAWRFRITNKRDNTAFYKWMYKNSNVFLDRKYQIYKKAYGTL